MVTRGFNRHRPGARGDIFIFSAPRSGSTWLMEAIYTQPGVKYINEPLAKTILDYHGFLPIRTRWDYLALTASERAILAAYFRGDEKIRHFGPWNIFDRRYAFRSHRRVFKIIRANALIEWFLDELGGDYVFLIRHPIAQALSSIRRGHECAVRDYVAEPEFAERYLTDDRRRHIDRVLREGGLLEQFVLEWCLDNLVPLEVGARRPEVLVVTYEELVLRPELMFGLLADRLALPDAARMLAYARRPSMVTDSSTPATVAGIRQGDRWRVLGGWADRVSEEVQEQLFEIVSGSGIHAYRFGDPLPDRSLQHFPAMAGPIPPPREG